MKRPVQLLLLLTMIGALAACKKDKLTAPNITGTWELRASFSGGSYLNYQPGNGNLYVFSGNSFTQYNGSNNAIAQGTYSIKTRSITVQGEQYNQIFFNGSQSGTEIQVQDTTMALGLQYNNGSGGVYAKIK